MLYVASVTVGLPGTGTRWRGRTRCISLIAGEEAGRELFRASSGTTSPAFEQVTAFAAVAVLLASMALGGLLLWRNLRHNPAALTLGVVALAYPLTLAGRFTAIGAELSARSAAFVFVGLAFVVALALVALFDHEQKSKMARRTVVAATMVVMVGGAILSFPYWARLPGSYLVSADPRSITPVGIDTADLDARPPGLRQPRHDRPRQPHPDKGLRPPAPDVGRRRPDRRQGRLLRDRHQPRRDHAPPVRARPLRALGRSPADVAAVHGVYVERGEIVTGAWTSPMPAAALDKWNSDPRSTASTTPVR